MLINGTYPKKDFMDNNCQSPCLLYIAPILLNISHIYSHYYHKYLLPIITFLLGRYHFFMLTVFCLAHFFLHPSLHFFPNSYKILFRNFPCFLFIQHLKFHHYSFFFDRYFLPLLFRFPDY